MALRIGLDQRIRNVLAANFGRRFASRREHGNPFLGVVSIGREHVDGVALKQPLRCAAHAFPPKSGQALIPLPGSRNLAPPIPPRAADSRAESDCVRDG